MRNSHSGRPPVGREKRGTKHLPSWRATRRSCRPARTCSVPGGGTNALQTASLYGPSLSSGFPSGLVVSPPGRSATLTMFNTRQIRPTMLTYPTRVAKVRYNIEVAGFNNPWAASMRPYMQRLLGTNNFGAKTLEFLTAAWAKNTSDTYINAIKPYFQFCEEQGLPPLAATAATMARYIVDRGTWHHQGNKSATVPFSSERFLQGLQRRTNRTRRLGSQGPAVSRSVPSFPPLQPHTLVPASPNSLLLSTPRQGPTHAADRHLDSSPVGPHCTISSVSSDGAHVHNFFVAGELELSAGRETYCVLQPVESSSTTERQKVNAVLPGSENSYVNYRTRPT
jgi:hypothetical protein